jgi:beta-xylosidase
MMDKPLVNGFHNGAQPIDAHLFKDDDGTVYLYYGGWRHCNVCRMNEDMTGLLPLIDGSEEYFREITPEDYVEAPCMMKYKGKYYFMWSAGNWMAGSYRVNYCSSDSPIEGFNKAEKILSSQLPLAEGPGHHGFLYLEETDEHLIVYHRRIPGDTIPGHRVLCIDKMKVADGKIEPVIMTESFKL